MGTGWKVLLGVLFPPLGIYWLLTARSIGRTAKIAIGSVAGVILLIIIVAAAAGGSGSNNAAGTNGTTTEAATTEATTTEATTTEAATTEAARPAGSTPRQRVKNAVGDSVAASGYAGDVKIKDVSFFSNFVSVTANTPEGGIQGASCGDLDNGAQAIFQKIYDRTGWRGNAVIEYTGGLVSTETGKPLPDALTGRFNMAPAQARQINWSNENQLSYIDWSNYRTFCHSALKH